MPKTPERIIFSVTDQNRSAIETIRRESSRYKEDGKPSLSGHLTRAVKIYAHLLAIGKAEKMLQEAEKGVQK